MHAQELIFKVLPVESIAHLNSDQHRQGHGHGGTSLKDLTVDAGEVLVLIVALHEVGLHREERRGEDRSSVSA